jgi:hypothetical protein
MVRRYKVGLEPAERARLIAWSGRAREANRLAHARILLFADEGAGGRAWKDHRPIP